MRFLLKCIFWLGGVFLLMPGLTGKQNTPAIQVQQVQQNRLHTEDAATQALKNASPDLIEQWKNAGKTLQEISTFCERNPALCVAGKAAAQQAGAQAIIRAKDTYDAMTNPAILKQEPISAAVNPRLPKTTVPFPVPIPVPIPVPAPRP